MYLPGRLSYAYPKYHRQERLVSSGNTFELSPEEHTRLLQQIADHRKSIQILSSLVNANARVNKLPEELLLKVFRYYIDVWARAVDTLPLAYLDPNVKVPGYHGWLQITHVCRRWRDVALRHSNLWAEIKLCRLETVEAFLERSGKVPLSIYVPSYRDHAQLAETMRARVLKESHRIEDFHVESVGDAHRVRVYECEGFPILKRLMLSIGNGQGTAVPSYLLKNGPPPRLEWLQAMFCTFDAVRPLFNSGMRHLAINGHIRQHQENATEWHVFLPALEAMPQLEVLALNYCLPAAALDNGALPDVGKRITLPNLKRLEVCGHSIACTTLARQLSYPASARATFQLTATSEFGPHGAFPWEVAQEELEVNGPDLSIPVVMSTFVDKLHGAGLIGDVKPVVALTLDSKSGTSVTGPAIRMFTAGSPWTFPLDATAPHNSVKPNFELFFPGFSPQAVFRTAVQALPLQNVERVFVDCIIYNLGLYVPAAEDWAAAFTHCTALKEMYVQAIAARHLPAALIPLQAPDAVIIPFPKLEQLHVLAPAITDTPAPLEWIGTMRDALQERVDAGARLRRLQFIGPKNPDFDVAPLEAVADVVEWDADEKHVQRLPWVVQGFNALGMPLGDEGDLFMEAEIVI